MLLSTPSSRIIHQKGKTAYLCKSSRRTKWKLGVTWVLMWASGGILMRWASQRPGKTSITPSINYKALLSPDWPAGLSSPFQRLPSGFIESVGEWLILFQWDGTGNWARFDHKCRATRLVGWLEWKPRHTKTVWKRVLECTEMNNVRN